MKLYESNFNDLNTGNKKENIALMMTKEESEENGCVIFYTKKDNRVYKFLELSFSFCMSLLKLLRLFCIVSECFIIYFRFVNK